MAAGTKRLRVAFAVALQDAGEATRSLEIAKGLREYSPDGWSVECVFLSHGSRFTPKIVDAGFEVYDCSPKLGGVGFMEQLNSIPPRLRLYSTASPLRARPWPGASFRHDQNELG